LGGQASMIPSFVFWSTLFVYNLHRIIAAIYSDLYPERGIRISLSKALNIRRFRTTLLVLLFLSVLICCDDYFSPEFHVRRELILAAAISLAYALPIFKGKRLRDFPYVKIFFIAFVWTYVTVILPNLQAGKPIESNVIVLGIARLLFIFAITIPFDIRDLEIDRSMGVRTIPTALGAECARRIALYALGASFACSYFLYFHSAYSIGRLAALGISLIFAGIMVQFSNEKRGDYYYGYVVDGMMLLQGLLVLMVNG